LLLLAAVLGHSITDIAAAAIHITAVEVAADWGTKIITPSRPVALIQLLLVMAALLQLVLALPPEPMVRILIL
jgi:hypothetical protein